MREQELMVYRNFEDGELLYDMAWLMSHYNDEFYNAADLRALFYDCIHKLIELAGNYGFHGNLWHCYLANLLKVLELHNFLLNLCMYFLLHAIL